MNRRTFLHHTCHSLAMPGLVGSFGFSLPGTLPGAVSAFLKAATETDRVLVLIYLQGGNDGLNTVVPLDQYASLTNARPHVILPEKKLLSLPNQSLGLHPALEGFKSLYGEGRLAIVQSVGYPGQDYSHFRSTDIWMSGSSSQELVNSGWTGRYLSHEYPAFPEGYPNEATPDPLAIEIGYGSSLLFQGPASGTSMVLSNPEDFYRLVDNTDEEAPNTPAGDRLKHVRLIARQSQKYGAVVKKAAERVTNQKPYPEKNELAQQLKVVSRLIAGGLKTSLYLVRMGGFDTHDAQVDKSDHTVGEHASLLKNLNDAVMAFMNDLKQQGQDDRVVGMTFSEFGRRIVSNASLGTDHGAASPLFVFGNKVMGSVIGKNPVIPANATFRDNLPMQYDFRQVYASVLEQWFAMPASDISTVMLSNFKTLPIIGDRTVTGLEKAPGSTTLRVYPNPLNGQATVEFQSKGEEVSLEAVDTQGRKVAQIFAGYAAAGKHTIGWNTSELTAGHYFVLVRSATRNEVKSVVKRQ